MPSKSEKPLPTSGVTVSLEELLALQQLPVQTLKSTKILALRSGSHLSQLKGRGMDFSETRRYQAGDDIRHMEWRVTARSNSPHVKLYHEEKERPVFFVVDFNPSMFFGTKVAFKSVIAARFTAMLAFAASHHGDRVGGIVYSGKSIKKIKPKARKQGVLPLLNELSHFSEQLDLQTSTTPLSEVLKQLRMLAKPGSLIFLLSDFNCFDEPSRASLSRIQQHNDVFAYLISDPLEKTPPKAGIYPISDGKSEAYINTGDNALRKHYQSLYHKKLSIIAPLFKTGRLFEISTDSDIEQLLYNNYSLTRLGES